jgi:hypothetical protein
MAMAHLGLRQRMAGDPAFRVTLHRATELATIEDDHDALMKAALGGTRAIAPRASDSVDEELVAVLEAALARVDDDAGRARLLSALAQELAADADGARRHAYAEEALERARKVGRAALLTEVLARRPSAYAGPDHLAVRLECTAENIRIAPHTDDLHAWWSAVFTRLATAVQAGLGDEVPVRMDQLTAATAMTDGAPHRCGLHTTEAWVALLHGRVTIAERHAREAFTAGKQLGEADAFGVFVGQILSVRRAQGRLGELTADVRAALAQPAMNPSTRPIAAETLAEIGDTSTAGALLRAEMAESLADTPEQFRLTVAGAWGRVAVLTGNLDAAERLVELLDPYRDQVDFNGAYVVGAVAQVTGMLRAGLGRTQDARHDLDTARDLHRALAAPLLLDRTDQALRALDA